MVYVSTCNAITHLPYPCLHNLGIGFKIKHVKKDYCNNPYLLPAPKELREFPI